MVTTERRRRHGASLDDAPPAVLISGAGETHVGHVRRVNQDVIVADPTLGLYAVLDGMGGGNAGDVAARLASEVITDCVRKDMAAGNHPPTKLLEIALMTASAAVVIVGANKADCAGMGTTAVACLVVDPTRVIVAHLGDSRAYLLRGREFTQLTRDHTVAQELLDQGKLRARSMRSCREAHMLTRCVGCGGQPEVHDLALQPGDRLLLCSDGLHGYTQRRSIRRVLAGRGAPEDISRGLVALALRGDAPDNVSAVVITVDGREHAAAAKPRSGLR